MLNKQVIITIIIAALAFGTFHYRNKYLSCKQEVTRLTQEVVKTVEAANKYKDTTDKLLNNYDNTIKDYEDKLQDSVLDCDIRIKEVIESFETQEEITKQPTVVNYSKSTKYIQDINKKLGFAGKK